MQNPISEQARAAALAQLDAAEAAREDILVQHIANGVVIDSRTVQIDPEVVIAPGAVILAGTILRGKTVIGAGCVIGPNTLIEDSTVDEGTTVNASQIYGSHIGPHNNIGPFTHVRVNTVTDYGVHLGAYVETKNSNFARGNTVSHLTYIGDSDVGKYCNFGCGTVTCNYDGKDKFRTQIGDYCFIGCNTNLVAPVKVGDGAYTAAGSTITKDVPAQALGIARDRQTNLEGWAAPKMEAYIAKKQAEFVVQQLLSCSSAVEQAVDAAAPSGSEPGLAAVDTDGLYAFLQAQLGDAMTADCLNKIMANRLPTRITALAGQSGDKLVPSDLTLKKRAGAENCYDFSAALLTATDSTAAAQVSGTITMVKEEGRWKASAITLNL